MIVCINHSHRTQIHVLIETNLAKEINRTASASAEGTEHERLDAVSAPTKGLPDVVHHRDFVCVGFETTQCLTLSLRGQCERTSSRACESGMEPERRDATPGSISEELEIVERTAPSTESVEDRCPPGLFLVTMCKLNMCVRQGIVGSGQLLESDDRDVGRRAGP